MKKFDLRNGMAVKLRDMTYVGDCVFGLVIDNLIYFKDKRIVDIPLCFYNDDLMFEREGKTNSNEDIIEVYNITRENKIDALMCQDEQQLELIWKRDEFDWSKIPIGTKVLVSDDNMNWIEAYYLNYNKKGEFKYYTLSSSKSCTGTWKYCKLAEEQEYKEITYNDMIDGFNDYCDTHTRIHACEDCDYIGFHGGCDVNKFMMKNYNITKK